MASTARIRAGFHLRSAASRHSVPNELLLWAGLDGGCVPSRGFGAAPPLNRSES